MLPGQENSMEITWKDFLDKVDSVFPSILLCSHVCKARVDHHEVASYSDTYIATYHAFVFILGDL